MIYLEAAVALLACGVLTLSTYLYLLYVESVRFRARESVRSFEFFEDHVAPLLKLQAEDGMRRFAMARQVMLILLTVVAVHLSFRANPFEVALPLFALLESLIVATTGLILFVHIAPSILLSRTRGTWVQRFVPLARVIAWCIQPVVLLSGFASSVAELGAEEVDLKKNGSGATADIEALLNAGQEEGLIGEEDRKLIQSVVEFGDKTVREAMTPRPEIVAIEANSSLEALRQLLIENEFSRVPVYEGDIDSIIGFVHGRDTLEIDEDRRQTAPVRTLLRTLPLVPETKPIHHLLREMQEQNVHMAIVIDEYGHTAGLATMEDLMEEIVGEIRDESEPETDVVEQPDHSFIADGNVDLDRLDELVDFRPADEFETTTIGGLVCEHLGHVPSPGAKVQIDGIEIEVLTADERRVNRVRVRRLPPTREQSRETPASETDSDRTGAA